MRDDTAFMDRIHAYLPGWDVPKLDPSYFTDHFGFVSDFLAEVWSQLRRTSRLDVLQGRLEWGSQLSGRDRKAVNNTVDGLLRLLYPDPEMEVPDEFLAWAASLALEMRRRVKEAQAFIGAAEFGKVDLSFSIGGGPETVVYCDESRQAPACGSTASADRSGERPSTARCCRRRTREVSRPAARRRDYAVGDTIGGRFEVVEVLGQRWLLEGLPRARRRRGRGASAQALRQRRRLRRGSPRDRRAPQGPPPERRRGDLGRQHRARRVVPHHGVHRRRDCSPTTPPARSSCATARPIDVALDVLDALDRDPSRQRATRRTRQEEAGRRDLRGRVRRADVDCSENALVHRDIKPQNIMLTRAGAKLLDFNIASRVGDPVRTVSGTPPYQPPDADLTRWDVSTDLFAVGRHALRAPLRRPAPLPELAPDRRRSRDRPDDDPT